jgi:prepilin-type N-terminal cleavage/methylation domain-containing protein
MRRNLPGTRGAAGFTLVELMMVVAMIGILSAIAIPSFQRYVKRSRLPEATATLQKLWMGAQAYYEADHADATGTVLSKRFPGGNSVSIESSCCGSSDRRCAGNSTVYLNNEPWRSLAFNLPQKHFFRPVFFAFPSAATDLWIYTMGDMDCDGVQSTIEMRVAPAVVNREVRNPPMPAFVNELE